VLSLPFGQSARSASILIVDDEPDVADLFCQHFRHEARHGIYVMHFAASGAEALDRLSGEIRPALVAVLSDGIARTRSDGGNSLMLTVPAASVLKIRQRRWAKHVPVEVGRNSRCCVHQ
jgi:hypothetical protein